MSSCTFGLSAKKIKSVVICCVKQTWQQHICMCIGIVNFNILIKPSTFILIITLISFNIQWMHGQSLGGCTLISKSPSYLELDWIKGIQKLWLGSGIHSYSNVNWLSSIFHFCIPKLPWWQGSQGQHGAHLGPRGTRWAPCWPHELCYMVRCGLSDMLYCPLTCFIIPEKIFKLQHKLNLKYFRIWWSWQMSMIWTL